MKTNDLIKKLKQHRDKDLEFVVCYQKSTVEIWTDNGKTLICEVPSIR